MPTDPMISWIIALGIATVYGWLMYRRGFNAGGVQATQVICASLMDAKVMQPKRLYEIVEQFWAKQQQKDEEE